MAKKVKKRKEIKQKLLHKYRLVILNESTFEEKISFKLSRMNVFVTGSLFHYWIDWIHHFINSIYTTCGNIFQATLPQN